MARNVVSNADKQWLEDVFADVESSIVKAYEASDEPLGERLTQATNARLDIVRLRVVLEHLNLIKEK